MCLSLRWLGGGVIDFQIKQAELDWGDDGLPRSRTFGDVYFSAHDPLAETDYVFLQGNQLASRFENITDSFVIMETGFGSGLNFLSAWALWDSCVPAESKAMLHFISCEKFPLHKDDLERIHGHFTSLSHYASELQKFYPSAIAGVHHLVFAHGRVRLTLFYGDVADLPAALPMKSCVDAWFLDGFAPRKNPLMWTDMLYAWMASVSKDGASLATFSAAGAVRRGLKAVGFNAEKAKGYGYKADMTVASYVAQHDDGAVQCKKPRPLRAVVIGGGVAGCSAAYALAQRGVEVQLIERHDAVGREASGNPAGILFPLLNKTWSPQVRFYAAAFDFSRQMLLRLLASGVAVPHDVCGMIQIAKGGDAEAQEKLLALPHLLGLDPKFAHPADSMFLSEKAGVCINQDGLYFPQGTWVDVPALCAAWTQHPLVQLQCQQEAISLRREGDVWAILDAQGCVIAQAEHVVLANALDVMRLLPNVSLPLRTIQGQVSYFPVTAESSKLRSILCFGGYISPAQHGLHCAGATYDHHRTDCIADSEGHKRNLDDISAHVPSLGFAEHVDVEQVTGRAALRVVSRDRLPVIGKISGCNGVYLSVAHASRGLLSAPLAGEWLAAEITNNPLPVTADMVRIFSPERFKSKANPK